MADSHGDEVGLEMKVSAGCPVMEKTGFVLDFVWKSTSFDRMHGALHTLARDESSVSQFLYHKLLGHEVDDILFKVRQWETIFGTFQSRAFGESTDERS